SRILGLTLVRWSGVAEGIEATWLRWATADGKLLPTPEEAERERAERAEHRVAELEERLAALEQQVRELKGR
ncbi:MAG: Uma2 family endonuclease, partial [Chloroflexota bacterium]|nr:Uma2 family endonuclease [Chloroflexota bacterium]